MVTSLVASAFSPNDLRLKSAVVSKGISITNIDEKPLVKDDGKKKITKRDDTTRVPINPTILIAADDNDETSEVDSLLAFPSNDLYSTWDTSTIHPYSFIERFKQDSAVVRLTEPTDCGFVLPFKGNVTSEFGWRHRRPHYGTDIDLETGDTVVAAFDGPRR